MWKRRDCGEAAWRACPVRVLVPLLPRLPTIRRIQKTEMKKQIVQWAIALIPIPFFVALAMWGFPKYRVYTQTLRGEADFREAEINRKIEVEEAKAKEEALMLIASGEADRERIKAEATAAAIDLVGKALSEHPDYLRLHWINEIAGGEGERIYIPTEAGMPILEARPKK